LRVRSLRRFRRSLARRSVATAVVADSADG